VGDNPQVNLSYIWEKEENDEFEAISGETNSSLELTGLTTEPTLDECYRYEVAATRNRSTTDSITSGKYRVTNKPATPVVENYTYVDGQLISVAKRANN